MSKQEPLERSMKSVLDLSLTGQNGDFLCPECGLLLSPDDETEENYYIIETTVNRNELESVLVQCQRCMREIRLIGFSNVAPIVEGE